MASEIASQALDRGAYADAVGESSLAVGRFQSTGQAAEEAQARSRRAAAYLALGQADQARDDLQRALSLLDAGSADRAAVLAQLGQVDLALGNAGLARAHLEEALELAREVPAEGILASVLNDAGHLWALTGESAKALAAFEESADLATHAGDRLLGARAAVNAAHVEADNRRDTAARAHLEQARTALEDLPATTDLARTQAELARVYARLPAGIAEAYRAYRQAVSAGEQVHDDRVLSLAYGDLGALYEREQRLDEALQLTEQATRAASRIDAADLLYRWQWQTGRLLSRLGDRNGAIAVYRRAVSTVQAIRGEMTASALTARDVFERDIKPPYYELADLLLRRSDEVADRLQRQRLLAEARDTVELLKSTQIQNYFHDECLVALQAKSARIERLAPRTAAIYPVLLPDRTELLVDMGSGMERHVVTVGAQRLGEEVYRFRQLLEKRTTGEYLAPASQLYRWLIEPLEPSLHEHDIDTLVFVPDGPLYTVPMAALHDGRRFLVNRYALVVTPGLSLTDPHPLPRQELEVLSSGLSGPVQGYGALPHVPSELAAIHRLYAGTQLADERFTGKSLRDALARTPYSIVHIASHGRFSSENRNSYVLTYDDRLSMNQLERLIGLSRFRDNPVEMLMLSACETAAGDQWSALGLAGIALKAGARSAVASLWFINDQASALLTAEFYRLLHDSALTKAKALQQAQIKVMNDGRYDHPAYWSPFLLIGNWM